MTKFWGKLFLINFAMGVVTGIVQEFQFGMNWSDYSRFVGDVFGAPLAIEGLLAFFLESTFLGLWIFGWDRLPKRVHLATIWIAGIGTVLSAYFILAANSWMQHPVGSTVNPVTHRAEMNDFAAVLTNSTAVGAFAHTITAAFLSAGMLILGISAWHLVRGNEIAVFRSSLRVAIVTVLIAGLGTVVTGDLQARLMTQQQPMKMAAAEALYQTSTPASFSLFTVGSLDGSQELWSVRVPKVLSFMATGSPEGTVEGINDVQRASEVRYGAGNYTPNIPVAYWTFRVMIGFGALALLIALAGLWLQRRGRIPRQRWFAWAAIGGIGFPVVANSVGWIFTEMGRQPWAVYGQMTTARGVSPSVGPWSVATSLTVFTLLYGALAVVEIGLLVRYARRGPDPVPPASTPDDTDAPRPLALAY
jgi:cytochrome d ubiquinol oxidase subunit I